MIYDGLYKIQEPFCNRKSFHIILRHVFWLVFSKQTEEVFF